MMVKPGVVIINNGPREHRYRPSIDVLFRSAAVYYRSRVIAIILTGMLDDGSSGMVAVKRCGGTAIVQDPEDAEFSQMPVHVLNRIKVDYVLALDEIGNIAGNLLSSPLNPDVPVPDEILTEVEMTERIMTSIDQLSKIADRTDFICPDCGGGLWKIKNDPPGRYRCHVGHVYSENQMIRVHSQQLEESLWVSARMLEERRNMMEAMLKGSNDAGRKSLAAFYKERIRETEKHISTLKTLLSDYTENLRGKGDQIA
jgi:two-component system chemotaxis response regulator CheB